MSNLKALAFGSFLVLGACGPTARDTTHSGDDDDTAMPDAPDMTNPVCTPVAEVCNDGIDNDCDGRIDCGDPDCSGVDGCPVCGEVNNPMAAPLALPDGVSSGATCSVDANCAATPATPNCVFKECHASYNDVLNFVGFPDGATLDDTSKLISVCAKMEHSWMHDLQVELIAPNGTSIALLKFAGRNGGEVFLGKANDADTDANPVPGTGYEYCWGVGVYTMVGAPSSMYESYTNPADGEPAHYVLPAGTYNPEVPFSALQGVPLNGNWSFRVTDLWAEDNGYLFDWSIKFDPSLVADCTGPIIE